MRKLVIVVPLLAVAACTLDGESTPAPSPMAEKPPSPIPSGIAEPPSTAAPIPLPSRRPAGFSRPYVGPFAVDRTLRLAEGVAFWPYPESTEGGRRVSVLRRQEGAPVLLG